MGDERPGTDQGLSAPAAGRAIDRRHRLPSARAAIGALLVTLAVLGMFVANRRAHAASETEYVVVAKRLERGAVVTAADLAVRPMALSSDVAELVVEDPNTAVGSVALQTLLPGQLLQFGALGAAGEVAERFEVSLELDRSAALGGALGVGDTVDLLATIIDSPNTCTTTVVRSALVVRVAPLGSDPTSTSSRSIIVSLALDSPRDVLAAVVATADADTTLVRSTREAESSLDGTLCLTELDGQRPTLGDSP